MASNSFQHRRDIQVIGDIKPIAEDEVIRLADERDVQFKRVNWNNTKLIVRTCLTYEEYEDTVKSILDYCRTDDGGIAVEMVDFAVRVCIIAAYALIELPNDFDRLYRVVYVSNLYETVCNAVCVAQVDAIKQSVKTYINE